METFLIMRFVDFIHILSIQQPYGLERERTFGCRINDRWEIIYMSKDGYDFKNNKYVMMIEAGIIDPSKVERVAVENAVSAASTFITSFATITDQPNDSKWFKTPTPIT